MDVKRYARIVIESLGTVVEGQRYVKVFDPDGELDYIKKVPAVIEKTFEGYGFKMSFMGETDRLAIIFNDKLVYNNVSTAYSMDKWSKISPVFAKLCRENERVSSTRNLYYTGDWEQLLIYLADHAEEIKAKKKALKAETDRINKLKSDFNQMMLIHLPFDVDDDGTRFYADNTVIIEGTKDALIVYLSVLEKRTLFGGGRYTKGDKVFDFRTKFYRPGAWEDHVNELIESDIEELEETALSEGYDPRTLRSLDEIAKEREAERIKNLPREKKYISALEQIDKLKQFL